jgi:hypothetical protein
LDLCAKVGLVDSWQTFGFVEKIGFGGKGSPTIEPGTIEPSLIE